MQFKIFLSSCLILVMSLLGCSQQSTFSPSETPSPPVNTKKSPPVTSSSDSPSKPSKSTLKNLKSAQPSPNLQKSLTPVSENHTISTQGIGNAKLSMTFGKLKQVLAPETKFQIKSPFIVDFDAIAIVQADKIQYYVLYPAGSKLKDRDQIEILLTDNPDYKTTTGIGVGTKIKDAETAYGKATLSYNLDNEGREYVKFANQPSKRMSFRLGAYAAGNLAGIYSGKSASDGLHETNQYKNDATITAVEIH